LPIDDVAAQPAQPAQRADAARNRARIVEAAKRVFASNGDFGPEAVAREAGVGVGTLYRHFPDRNDLAAAVYEDELLRVADSAHALLEEHTPRAALRLWMDRFAERFEHKRAMGPALRSLTGSGSVSSVEIRARLASAVREIVEAGAIAGELRADVSSADLVAAIAGVCMACATDESRPQLDRLMDLLVDGVSHP
jgi:AcrR family transcriptional regulator